MQQEAPGAMPRRPLVRILQALAVALVLGLLALLVWRVVTRSQGADLVASIRRGERPAAPAFLLPVIWARSLTWPPELRAAVTDGRLSVVELRGRPAVLNFWASWCGPCKAEAPLLVASARAHAGVVAFVGIDVQDFASDARRFLRRFETNYPSVRDGGSSTSDRYGLTGVPETYFIDRSGRIVAHSPGQVSRRELEAGVAAALGSR